MSEPGPKAVVVDTMVMGWLVVRDPFNLGDVYRRLIGEAAVVLAFQTVAELRFGALNANWGEFRRRKLDRELAGFEPARPDDIATTVYAQLKHTCRRGGHALWEKQHDGDRWIAALAVRLGIPLVSHDEIFRNVPGLTVVTALA